MDTQKTENLHTADVFIQLSNTQWRFVTALIENPAYTKADAASHIGITADTVYRWPDYVNQALEQARRDVHDAALAMRRQAVLRAVDVKLRLLDSPDESIRSKAASEIIEWELGKATQSANVDITTGGAPMTGLIINLSEDGD